MEPVTCFNGLRLWHLGGADGVTGSSHLMVLEGRAAIMVDCGAAMGRDRVVPFAKMPVSPRDMDYLFITHAHHDHIGRIPDLLDAGFSGEIICTHGTKRLLVPMLRDAMAFSGRSRADVRRLERAVDDLSWGFEYDRLFHLKHGINFSLGQAGHILGSCFIRFGFQPAVSATHRNPPFSLVFSGDLGCENSPILPDPATASACDLLILESTYGDRNHPDRDSRVEKLGTLLTRLLRDRGKVYVPVFSLGRTQELIYELDRLFTDNRLRKKFPFLSGEEKIPVFVDSPLGLEVTKIYAALHEFWDREARGLLNSGDHPIDFSHLYGVETHQSHRKLREMPGPAIILAGSGMCTGGRILGHLDDGLTVPENDVLFAGYQARGTLGREILESAGRSGGFVRINGRKREIRAKVHHLTGYSAHADQTGLIRWVASMPEKPGRIKLVHGERRARRALQKALMDKGYRVAM